jgi:GNAT superfamily N-acetyltransferase
MVTDNHRRPLFADIELARRLEMTDALAGVEFARAWAKVKSFAGEVFVSVAGGYGGFGGVDSPLTQAFGLGLNGPLTDSDMARMEDFYQSHGAPVNVETCPLADPTLLKLLNERGYRPIEYSNVSIRELDAADSRIWPDPAIKVQVRTPEPNEAEAYCVVVIKSFFENLQEVSPQILDIFTSCFHAANSFFFLAELDGAAAGGGMMSIHQGVASFGGAGTLPEFRNRGVQKALLLARIAAAARAGCDLAMVATGPGTGSQRNVERLGFRVVYTRTKFLKELPNAQADQ